MLARQIRRPRPGLGLLQHPDDLIFREPCSLHLSVLQEGRTLNPRGEKSQWQVRRCKNGEIWLLLKIGTPSPAKSRPLSFFPISSLDRNKLSGVVSAPSL